MTWNSFKKIDMHILYNNICHILICCFLFHVLYYVHLTIWNLIVVSKNNFQWSVLLPNFYVGKAFDIPLTEKLKFKLLYLNTIWNAFPFFGILNNLWFCLWESIFNCSVAIINHGDKPTYFAQLALTCYFNSAFLSYLSNMNWIPSLFIRKETFLGGKLRNLWNFLQGFSYH